MSRYNHPFLFFTDSEGDKKSRLCCRCLNVDLLERILKESVLRHHCTINSDSHSGPSLMVKQVELKLLPAS